MQYAAPSGVAGRQISAPDSRMRSVVTGCLTCVFWRADGLGERLRRHSDADPALGERSEAVSPLLAGRGI